MALRCARLDRLLISRTLAPSVACKRHASSSALLVPPFAIDAEQPIQAGTQPRDTSIPLARRLKVDEYLQYVEENKDATLADLETFRPPSHPPVGTPDYEKHYQALLEKLDRSFTVKQLRGFLRLYGAPVSSNMRKRTAATAVIEKQWGWPSLAKSQKMARARMERSSREFLLSPQQAFLLLGKDGSEILSLSKAHNVRLQFSRKPLSLTIYGSPASLEKLEEHIETVKKEIVWQDFNPPREFDLSSSSQKLSRASGCFLEGISDGNIRIWYRQNSSDSPSLTKRLIVQHSVEDADVPLAACPSKMTSSRASPNSGLPAYALYPFFCEPTRSPGNKGHFRLRRVGRWFGEEENLVFPFGGGVLHDYFPAAGSPDGCYTSPREQLLAQQGESGVGCRISVTATPGHLIFNSQTAQTPAAFLLAPPFEGQKNFADVMNWIQEASPGTEFIHGAPMRLWQAPDPKQRWRRRLVYETIPNPTEQAQMLVCEYTPVNTGVITGEGEADVDPSEFDNVSEPVVRCGSVSRLDVLMPDDAKDLRLTLVKDSIVPESSWPTDISVLVKNCTSSLGSDALLMFEHEKKKFILKEDTFVQSNRFSSEAEHPTVGTISERRFDPQSSESCQSFEVHCAELTSDEAWDAFWSKCEKVVQDKSTPLEEVEYRAL